ncbi:hypothetical protein [Sporolituus thermophilus]|uniref:Uncharacterized protein n=1 Tax=Sporolituus thermophilus DSM 23256 TaxID=1123285 RepID=A0A1G7N3L3_9FIRM|nr:hypothetical protein [Sporolituus thermophilus]SDF68531.1 hypothetical protein SAMN05660235_02406 [Sporolituus thermophilus DSM 23256]
MANKNTGYNANNPEPPGLKDSAKNRRDEKGALHAAVEYIERK